MGVLRYSAECVGTAVQMALATRLRNPEMGPPEIKLRLANGTVRIVSHVLGNRILCACMLMVHV